MHPPCLTSRLHHNRYRCCLSISYASRRCHFTPRSRRLIIRLSSTHPISPPSFDLHTSPPLCSVHCFSLRFVFVRVICGQSHSLFMSVFHFWISLLAHAWCRSSLISISTSCPPPVVPATSMDMYIIIYWVHYSQYICLIIRCIYSPLNNEKYFPSLRV